MDYKIGSQIYLEETQYHTSGIATIKGFDYFNKQLGFEILECNRVFYFTTVFDKQPTDLSQFSPCIDKNKKEFKIDYNEKFGFGKEQVQSECSITSFKVNG